MRHKQSEKIFNTLKTYIPGGVNSPVRAFNSVDGDPIVIKSGFGSVITDADGNDFIDFVRATHSVLPHAKIIYISIKPSPRRWGLWSEMRIANDLVKNYSSNDSLLSYVDISSSMLGSNGKPKPSLFLNDSLHLSQSGYLLWSKILKPYLLAENK